MTDLSIIIVNYNTKKLTLKCLESILQKKWQHEVEIIVVDNASSDGSADAIKKEFRDVRLIESKENLGFAGGNNLGLKSASSKYILFLNSDTEVQSGALDRMIDFMSRSDYVICSCKLLNKDGTLQSNVGDLPALVPLLVWIAGLDDVLFPVRKLLPSFHRKFRDYYQGEKEVGWVSGSVFLVKKEVLDKIGAWDDKIFMYGEDVDLCFRAKRAGFKIGWTNQAEIIHLGGGSLSNPSVSQWRGEFTGLLYFYRKYYGISATVFLRLLIYAFGTIRMIAFFITGKPEVSKMYAKILISI